MARHYSPKAFLLEAPNRLLKQYFERLEIGSDISWEHLAERDTDLIYRACETAKEDLRRQMDDDFRSIHSMADEGGTQLLIDTGHSQFHNVDFLKIFEQAESHLERSFLAFLSYYDVFEEASFFHYADNLGNWRTRDQLPEMQKQPDTESRKRFEQDLSEYYRRKEGRGYGCQIDYYKRENKHYWFAHPEDYAVARLVYTEDHQLSKETQRPAFELIFDYSEQDNILRIYAKCDKATLTDLQKVFGRAILGVDLGDPPANGVIYELDALRERSFQFHLELEDGVETVKVKKLKLKVMGSDQRITLETTAKRDSKEIYNLLDKVLAGGELPRDLLTVASVGLQLVFISNRSKRSKTLSFNVSYPDSCSLKLDPKHELAKSLLKRWKLDVSGRADYTPPEPRLDAQYIIQD